MPYLNRRRSNEYARTARVLSNRETVEGKPSNVSTLAAIAANPGIEPAQEPRANHRRYNNGDWDSVNSKPKTPPVETLGKWSDWDTKSN